MEALWTDKASGADSAMKKLLIDSNQKWKIEHPLIKAIGAKMTTLRDLDYEFEEIAQIFAEVPSDSKMIDPVTGKKWRWHAIDDDVQRKEWAKVPKSEEVYRANVTTATGLHSSSTEIKNKPR